MRTLYVQARNVGNTFLEGLVQPCINNPKFILYFKVAIKPFSIMSNFCLDGKLNKYNQVFHNYENSYSMPEHHYC